MRRAMVVVAVLALAACGHSNNSTSGGSAQYSRKGSVVEPVSAGAGADGAAPGGNGPAAVGEKVALGRSVIRTSTMTVRVRDVTAARRDAVSIAERSGGYLEAEHSTLDTGTTLTFRVSPDAFTGTLDALGRLGEVVAREAGTEDVTGDVADVDGRLRAARASAARLRGLLDHATSVADLSTLESELSDRESDIESLASRQRALGDRTALATVTVTLQGPARVAAPEHQARGFTAGLGAGWRAFTASVGALLLVTGALLPFLLVAAAVTAPWLVLRRRRRASAPA